MKTKNLFSFQCIISVTFLIQVFVISACNQQGETKKGEANLQTTTEVSAVSMSEKNDTQTHSSESNNVIEVKPQTELKNSSEVIKEKTASPKTDIHTAVLKNDIETIKQHIAAKSDLNEKESFGGSTPLISASLFGRTEIAKLLIDAGAHLNIQNNDGSTALITASFFCRDEIVKMLLAQKADKSIKNKYGQTAYEILLPSFEEVKPVYDMLGSALAPMGLELDYAYIQKTRPVIAAMLK
jgi:uncharacterized protein